jgi:tetratricopeptide (TPR) repeat protein
MAKAFEWEQMTPADELRARLADAEKQIARLKGEPESIAGLYADLDRIFELWPQLAKDGIDLRPEAGRWETIQALVQKKLRLILRRARPSGGLAVARAQRGAVSPEAWWWRADEIVRRQDVARVKRFVVTVVVAAAVLFGGSKVFNYFFPQDPLVMAATSSLTDGQRKIQNRQDYAGALVAFQKALQFTPNDPDAILWAACTQEELGQTAEAEAGYSRARQLIGDEQRFRLTRVPIYSQLNMSDQALADINAVTKVDPENAQAYYYLANLYENQNQLREAAAALQTASDLSEKQNKLELTAMSRYRMAMLIQRMQGESLSSMPTPAR